MRNTHVDMPLHHIEYWTGTFFRAACLWEVGNYILVPHYSSGGCLCNELTFQKDALEVFQQEKDRAEQTRLFQIASSAGFAASTTDRAASSAGFAASTTDRAASNAGFAASTTDHAASSAASEAAYGWGDRLYDEEPGRDEEREEQDIDQLDENFDDDIQASAGYLDAKLPHIAAHAEQNHLDGSLPLPNSTTARATHPEGLPHGSTDGIERSSLLPDAAPHLPDQAIPNAPPGRDSLHNAYVRVIHVNGVHHLALVTCSCLGAESTHANLMSCRLIPTTFKRYRTLFTASVLDDFRISNLECKVSAYQYYHKLQRLTNPAAPGNVPSFYHELLRLSRLWRWMKKLKWAGYGHKSKDPHGPKSGELANFCPACPQPGINLPSNWREDENRWDDNNKNTACLTIANRWVYKHFFVADGNFKADHVRQKADSDVWLSEGGGMFSKRADYHAFLDGAIERVTVRIVSHSL